MFLYDLGMGIICFPPRKLKDLGPKNKHKVLDLMEAGIQSATMNTAVFNSTPFKSAEEATGLKGGPEGGPDWNGA